MRPSAGYALRLRLGLDNLPGTLGRMTTAIGEAGGDIDAVDLVEYRGNQVVPELLLKVRDVEHGQTIVYVQRQGTP
jgi:malate dehydrogenase (oxaloacetate-decarboxylating)